MRAVLVGLLFGTALGIGCEKPAPPREEAPALLFDPRRPYDRELEAFKKAGGDPTHATRPQSLADLSKLEPGKLYTYVVLPTSALVLSPTPSPAVVTSSTPTWTHPILAGGGAVLVAGSLRLEKHGDKLTKVIVDADSDAYCPTSEALRSALAALDGLKVPRDLLRVDHRPNADCFVGPAAAASSAVPKVSFGTVMVSVARRFEVTGKAVLAKRWELARYEVEEIAETFTSELHAAALPPLPPGANLAPFEKLLVERDVPALEKAIDAHDQAAVEQAYLTTSTTCNACHTTAGKAFIEVPSKLGETVPRL